MAENDLVRPSRDGDQFHYVWAARQCLRLLPGAMDLVAITIEGSSTEEATDAAALAGEKLIDVGIYFGSEDRKLAREVRYVQLKHSTHHTNDPWTASGLKKTISGFAERYAKLCAEFPATDVAARFRFSFTTNRAIAQKVCEAVEDIATGRKRRHPRLSRTLMRATKLRAAQARAFFSLLELEGREHGLWDQRNLLSQDLNGYLPGEDVDAPVQLKELVTRKATSEFKDNPSIRRHDVLRALKVTEEVLQPAPCLIVNPLDALPREQEAEMRRTVLVAPTPVIVHADGGVGKSVMAARLAAEVGRGSEAVLYDCFGDGLYRNALNFRHRHRDAIVQIANELAARGLCHPLLPTSHADAKRYMSAFLHRLRQAVGSLRATDPNGSLVLIIDAADNAELAAAEQKEPGSFVRDLVRTPLPDGVRLVLTCRSHRRDLLQAPPDAVQIALNPFTHTESATHFRRRFSDATDAEAQEFAVLSSFNPRVQALALSQNLSLGETLRQLGPSPTTVEDTISELLRGAVSRLRDRVGPIEAPKIDEICRGLAVLRPLVPIPVLAALSEVPESAIRSFAFDLGRPLLVKGDSLHFLDEPAETWFREQFRPGGAALSGFLDRLRPLADHSSYIAAALPALLLEAGRLDEVVDLALSGQALPTGNPLERRDVEIQRLTFALKASLRDKRYLAAAKLALKAGKESAGEQRQNNLIQGNTDIAALLMAPDRIEEIVSRRTFGSGWMGSRHAYDAGLLSGRSELAAEASSRLRMAVDWLYSWGRAPRESRHGEEVDDDDRAELALAILRLRGARGAVNFLGSWRPLRLSFEAGRILGRRLFDLGRADQVDSLAEAAGDEEIWLRLALCQEARSVGHDLPEAPLRQLLERLADKTVKLDESGGLNGDWGLLQAITSGVEQALRVLPPDFASWADLIRRHLPSDPPLQFTERFGFDPGPLLRAYALEAALRGRTLVMADVKPSNVRLDNSSRSYNQDTNTFLSNVGGRLPWAVLAAEALCGRVRDLEEAIQTALKAAGAAERLMYRDSGNVRNGFACDWLRLVLDAGDRGAPCVPGFRAWLNGLQQPLWPDTLTDLCRRAARCASQGDFAMELSSAALEMLETSREEAETRSDSYVRLARAVLAVSVTEARAMFDRAVEISSLIGDENLDRWTGLLDLADAAGDPATPRPRAAYRLSQFAELTYEYVVRDKHFPWDRTVDALAGLCRRRASRS